MWCLEQSVRASAAAVAAASLFLITTRRRRARALGRGAEPPSPGAAAVSAFFITECSKETLLATQDFFVSLGFVVTEVFPADDPETIMVAGFGVRLQLSASSASRASSPTSLHLRCSNPKELFQKILQDQHNLAAEADARAIVAPNGLQIVFSATPPEGAVPFPDTPCQKNLVVSRGGDGGDQWVVGRAGMRYRDLFEKGMVGFIGSHIRIPMGGPVSDYTHHHAVALQLIFCVKGWAKLVYQDQGPAFLLEAGDLVLQPPGIRHQVLESSEGLEVVELASPAQHMTRADVNMKLPNSTHKLEEREYGGQRFVNFKASKAHFSTGPLGQDVLSCEMGVEPATSSAASAWMHVQKAASTPPAVLVHQGRFFFAFIVRGKPQFHFQGEEGSRHLQPGDSLAIPAGRLFCLAGECKWFCVQVGEPKTRVREAEGQTFEIAFGRAR